MYSMLKEIDKYIKKNGIPFDKVSFSYTYLPPYVNYVIVEKLRGLNDNNYFELGDPFYEISYDKNGYIYLIARSSIDNTSIVITNTDKLELDFKSTVIKESRILEEACFYKSLYYYRKKVEEKVSKYNITRIQRINLINKLLREEKNKKYKESVRNNDSILNRVDYKTPMLLATKKIIDYINYLNEEYQESLIEYIEEENIGEILKIGYTEPTGEGLETYTDMYSENNNYERINPIISASSRIEHLESFPYIYRGYAYNKTSNKEISYVSYLYNIGGSKYILILEPYNGTKYTKIIVLNKENIDKEEFKNYVRKYLEMNTVEYLDDKSAIRTSHTTKKKFIETINYSLLGVSNKELNPILKQKILKIRSGE